MLYSLLAGGLWVSLSRKSPGKRGVPDRRRHLGCAGKSVWGHSPTNRLQAGYMLYCCLFIVFEHTDPQKC